MKKLFLGLTIFSSLSAFTAEYIPVVEHRNERVDPYSVEFKCKQLDGKIISKAYYKEAVAGICMIGEKDENQDFTVIAIANQNVNNPYQTRGNTTVKVLCDHLGGELDKAVGGEDQIAAGSCIIKH